MSALHKNCFVCHFFWGNLGLTSQPSLPLNFSLAARSQKDFKPYCIFFIEASFSLKMQSTSLSNSTLLHCYLNRVFGNLQESAALCPSKNSHNQLAGHMKKTQKGIFYSCPHQYSGQSLFCTFRGHVTRLGISPLNLHFSSARQNIHGCSHDTLFHWQA